MKRNKEIKVRFFESEYGISDLKVKLTNLSRKNFCRQVLNGVKVRERPPAEYVEILRELRKTRNNVYQILLKEMQIKFVDFVMLQDICNRIIKMDEVFGEAFAVSKKNKKTLTFSLKYDIL